MRDLPWWASAHFTGAATIAPQPHRDVFIGLLDRAPNVHLEGLRGRFHNPLETDGDGQDNDGNGFRDDALGWNFAHANADVSRETGGGPTAGHGTAVAGMLVGARANGVWGTFPSAKVVAAVTSDDDHVSLDSVIDGLCYFLGLREGGLNLVAINASLGFCESSFNRDDLNNLREIVEALDRANVLIVTPAANRETRCPVPGTPGTERYCINHDQCGWLPATLDVPNVLGVVGAPHWGGVCPSLSIECFGHGATTLDLLAPCSDLWSMSPNGSARPVTGTSFAAPIVTGIAAMVMAYGNPPPSSARALRERLIRSTVAPWNSSDENMACSGGVVNAPRAIVGEGDAGAACFSTPSLR